MDAIDQHHETTHGPALLHLLQSARDIVEFELTADRRMDPPATDQLEDLGVGFLTVAATQPIEAQGPANAEGSFT